MKDINDIEIKDLVAIADGGSVTEEQAKKIKIYVICKLQEALKSPELTVEERYSLNAKIREYKADAYGVEDMGHPYVPQNKIQTQKNHDTEMHLDMYVGTESLM